MNAERLRQIEEIYHEALELGAERRSDFLRRVSESDETLADEVRSLIEHDSNADSFLDSTPHILAERLLTAADPDRTGLMIGHYRISGLLGKGGMGEVYLAEDTKLDRKVALKILPSEFVQNRERMSRFVREAKSASALNHPNIITIYEINEFEGTHFIAAEYIDGKTLKRMLDESEPSVDETVGIATQIASALEEAHSAGIVHRDIKPDNIMVRKNGLVKVLDFGIAKLAGGPVIGSGAPTEGTEDEQTKAGLILGTVDHMSPEQAEGRDVDTRTDVFSFGVVLYRLLSGRMPFEGENPEQTIRSILNDEPLPIGPSGSVPRSLAAIVEKCLRKDRDQRYSSASEILQDLRDFRNSVTTGEFQASATTEIRKATGSFGVAQKTPNSVPGRSLRRAAAILFAALLVAVGSFVSYRYFVSERPIDAIAVMPFVNDSGNGDFEYIADGMTETLIRKLSGIPSLSVKARNTVFTYKGRNVTAGEIGRDLSVGAVLFGHVNQNGDSLKLTLELVDSDTQDVVWGKVYERKINNLGALQAEIASEVVDELRLKISRSERDQLQKAYTSNAEARQVYLKGRFHWNKRNLLDLKRAIGYFGLAIEKDPNYALAYAGMADALALMPLYGDNRPSDYMPRAKESALKALEIDESLAEAHASLGYIYTAYDYDWESAEREFKRAIKLNPGYATAHQWYAEHLAFRGRTEEALQEIGRAVELDPLSLVINRMKGNILLFAGRHEEALAQFEKTGEMYPENAMVRFNIGDAYAARGMRPEAIGAYLEALRLSGEDSRKLEGLRDADRRQGWAGFWRKYLAGLEESRTALLNQNSSAYFDDESMAFAYAQNGNGDKTLEFLEKAFQSRNPTLITIGVSGAYDFLRDDPRFRKLIGDIGLSR